MSKISNTNAMAFMLALNMIMPFNIFIKATKDLTNVYPAKKSEFTKIFFECVLKMREDVIGPSPWLQSLFSFLVWVKFVHLNGSKIFKPIIWASFSDFASDLKISKYDLWLPSWSVQNQVVEFEEFTLARYFIRWFVSTMSLGMNWSEQKQASVSLDLFWFTLFTHFMINFKDMPLILNFHDELYADSYCDIRYSKCEGCNDIIVQPSIWLSNELYKIEAYEALFKFSRERLEYNLDCTIHSMDKFGLLNLNYQKVYDDLSKRR